MFSEHYQSAWGEVAELSRREAKPCVTHGTSTADLVPLLWANGFGAGGELDAAITTRSAELKKDLYGGNVYAIVPLYVTSICQEQCVYCNFRAGNKGVEVDRRRLSDDELGQEALFLIEQKNFRVLELVYATDPQVRVDAMCRQVELVGELLEQHGGGKVGVSAEPLEEPEYRRLVSAGLSFSVLWQETYDRERYGTLHPGRTKKNNFSYRVDAYERMISAGVPGIGMGVLSGLADWRYDWALLMLHEDYLQQQYGRGAEILGIPRLKYAPGALFCDSPATPSAQELVATLALHNIFSPATRAFVSTREDWELCVQLARGGGCLFTFNCSTTPGGYSLQNGGRQFRAHSFDAPVFAPKLEQLGLRPVFQWDFSRPAHEHAFTAVSA